MSSNSTQKAPLLAITGGVGGAKLALGLAQLLDEQNLVFAVNTGDDFEHLGLHISPDIDTLTYTLAQKSNAELGWGRQGETWQFIEALNELGGESWFRLGDKDMALHIRRRELLAAGHSLTETTSVIARALGIRHQILPMSNEPVRTIVHTKTGDALPFQHYFVRDRCAPEIESFEFSGIDQATPNKAILSALENCSGVVICPSNPYVSVDPMLRLPGMREAIKASGAPVVAVSPIVSGIAIKGPAAKMMAELDVPNTATSVARHYGGLLSGFVLDSQDAELANTTGVPTIAAQSIMKSLDDRVQLAQSVLDFLSQLTKSQLTK